MAACLLAARWLRKQQVLWMYWQLLQLTGSIGSRECNQCGRVPQLPCLCLLSVPRSSGWLPSHKGIPSVWVQGLLTEPCQLEGKGRDGDGPSLQLQAIKALCGCCQPSQKRCISKVGLCWCKGSNPPWCNPVAVLQQILLLVGSVWTRAWCHVEGLRVQLLPCCGPLIACTAWAAATQRSDRCTLGKLMCWCWRSTSHCTAHHSWQHRAVPRGVLVSCFQGLTLSSHAGRAASFL